MFSRKSAVIKPKMIPASCPWVMCSLKTKIPVSTVESIVSNNIILLPTAKLLCRITSIQVNDASMLNPTVTSAHFGPGCIAHSFETLSPAVEKMKLSARKPSNAKFILWKLYPNIRINSR